MRIKEIYIDGFGIYNDLLIKDLNPRLNIFYGLNEAGKSTLHAFQKRVLFGFPDKRSRLNPYPPLSGGRHGGRMVLMNDRNEAYTVERYSEKKGARVVGPDGSVLGEEVLSKLLGYVDESIFNSIFAFGLTELQDFDSLNRDKIRERLYSAGTGTGAASVPVIRDEFERTRSELFKLQGSKPMINQLFREMKDLNIRLREIGAEANEFDGLHNELSELAEKISYIENERNGLRKDLIHRENLQSVWEDWRAMVEAEEALQKLPKIQSFPENGITRLDSLLERIEEYENSIREIKNQLQTFKIQKSQISIDEKLVACRENVSHLQRSQEKYASAVMDRVEVEEKIRQERESLVEVLSNIGPDWNETKLAGFDASVPVRERIRKQQKALTDIGLAIRDVETEKRGLEREIRDAGKAASRIEKVDITKEGLISFGEYKQQKQVLGQIRVMVTRIRGNEIELRHLGEKLEWLSLPGFQSAAMLPLFLRLALVVLLLSGSFYLVYSLFRMNWVAGLAVTLVIGLSGLVYWLVGRKAAPRRRRKAEAQDARISDSASLVGKQAILKSELEKLMGEIREQAAVCGFVSVPEAFEIEKKEQELQTIYDLIKHREVNQEKKTEISHRIEGLCRQVSTFEESLRKMEEEKSTREEEWHQWLSEQGLAQDLSPEGALEMFNLIRTAREKRSAIEELENRKSDMDRFCKEFKRDVLAVMEKSGRGKGARRGDVLLELDNMSEALGEAEVAKNRLQGIDDKEIGLEVELKNSENKMKSVQNDLAALIKSGNSDSEDTFRENENIWRQRKELEERIRVSKNNIQRVSGRDEKYAEFQKELEESAPEELASEIEELRDKQKELESELAEHREERGKIMERIDQLERRRESSDLRLKFNLMRERLRERTEQWAIYTMAAAVMRRAVEKYEKERQPDVIREARSFFSRITLGCYDNFFAPLGEDRIYVESSRDGSRKDIGELSRGTSEQLYFALRFGFIKEFGKRSASLPVIFDDVLVNFDPERASAACGAIEELSKTNQVIYFTCHPETLELIENLIPKAKKLEMKEF